MKIKLPTYLIGSWLLSLTLFLAMSVPILGQSEMKTDAQIEAERAGQSFAPSEMKTDVQKEAERTRQQISSPFQTINGQASNRPMAFPDPYCEITGFSSVEAITRVLFSDIDNTSDVNSTSAHEDFTSVVGNVDAGETYTFTLEGYTGGNFSNYVIAWVDWDQDGVFDETTERYDIGVIQNSSGGDGVQVSADIEVPADALAGQTRMRVMKRFGSTPGSATSCAGATSWGQAEDYTVEVGGGGGAGGETCDAPIVVTALPFDDAGNTSDYGDNYSSGDVPPVATDAVTNGTGSSSYLNGDDVVYAYTPADDEVLNISTTNDDDWIGLWAFTGCPFTSTVGYHTATSGVIRSIEGLPVTAGETYYFVISTWPSPQSTDYTILIEKVGGDPDPSAYCIPEGTNANRYIDNFSTTGGTQDVSNMGSGFSPDGYGDFYDTHTVAQAQGEDVTFEVDIEGGTAGFRIWVDWNQDGVFDTTEEVAYASSGYSADHTGSFTVPADALEGDTRMRIVSHWLSSSGDIDPCETGFTYGEFEDYKFTVEAGTGGGTACEQDFAFSLDDGTGNLQTLLFADDFEIDSGTTMSVEKVTFRVFNNIGEATTLTIYEDDGGLPGNIVDTFSNVTPDSQTVIGSNFGFDAYDIVFTLPTVVELDSGIYWAAIQVTEGTDLATNYWVISNEGVHTPGQYSPDGGVTDRKS